MARKKPKKMRYVPTPVCYRCERCGLDISEAVAIRYHNHCPQCIDTMAGRLRLVLHGTTGFEQLHELTKERPSLADLEEMRTDQEKIDAVFKGRRGEGSPAGRMGPA